MTLNNELIAELESKPQIPWENRPVDMISAKWCWAACGGFMAVWPDGKAAVSWDGGRVVFGTVIHSSEEQAWVVCLNWEQADAHDMAYSYFLDGQEV